MSTRAVVAAVVAAAVAMAFALAATFVTRDWKRGVSQTTEQDFAQVIDLLTTDPTAAVNLISRGQFVRSFDGVDGDRLTGTIARREPDGTCWGVEVQVPKQWIADGTGTIDVSGLHLLGEQHCR